ncbi:hypothetical protein AB1Y20_000902 [Prymnesium parvum]|uniref:Uncharacterized protein n=1 Tax=Prymnesium parvum TaxID=97485 RepID=A0AB34KBZ3_PRYPA
MGSSAPLDALSRLQRAVSALSARVDALEHPEQDLLSATTSAFRPVEPTPCPLSPCLRSSALERISRNCSAAVWSGRWALDPRWQAHQLRSSAGWALQRFVPAAPECEPADPFVLASSHGAHVSVAAAQFTTSRLRGLRDSLWLMVGTSIDHGIVYEVCVRYGREGVRVAEAAPTRIHPRPGLHFNWCTLPPPLNLTMVEVSAQGLTTLAHQRDPQRHRSHLSEIQALLNTIGWHEGPTFLTLAGIEWDLKQWAAQQAVPIIESDWAVVRGSLSMQVKEAHNYWPHLKAVTLRTQFRTSYRFSARWVDQDVVHYARYSDLMRQLSRGRTGRLLRRRHSSQCGMLAVLDMARMMNCSSADYRDGCSRNSGWTRDGLHPHPWVYHQYFAISANVLADLGEMCSAT